MKKPVRRRVLMLLENNPYQFDQRPKREARALVRAGYRVSVISPLPPGGNVQEVVDGIHFYQFPPPPAANGFLGYLWEYAYATGVISVLSLVVLLREGFDILHAHNPPDTFFLIAAFYKLLGKRFVYDHHDLAPEMYYYARFRTGGNRLVYQILGLLEKLTCRIADLVLATNESYKAVEMERSKVPEERVTVVRNGPDLDSLHPADPDPELGLRASTILCYVGRISPQDGLDYLLRALSHLVYDLDRSDVLCVVIGDGDALSEAKTQASELQIEEHVLFVGWVSDPTLIRRYLATADIGVDPAPSNPYNDRCTMVKMMEYMALEKPIVAFDLPEHRVTAQDAAAYARPNDEFDFAQQIASLMDDPKRRREMGQTGRGRIEKELAWPHQEKYLLEAYKALSAR